MKNVKIGSLEVEFPSAWHEWDKHQFAAAARLSGIDGLSVNELKLRLFLHFTGLRIVNISKKSCSNGDGEIKKCHLFKKGNNNYFVDPEQLAWLLDDLFTYAFSPTSNGMVKLDYTCGKSIIDKFYLPGPALKPYYSPGDAMNNSTFEEFIVAMTHYEHWKESGKDNDLNKLVATLYRQGGAGSNPNDPRCGFDDNYTEKAAAKMSKLSAIVKRAIAIQFSGYLWQLQILFPEPWEDDGSAKVKAVRRDVFMEYMELTDALASNDVTKKEQVRKSMLYDVLGTWCSIIKANKRIEEQINKRRRK